MGDIFGIDILWIFATPGWIHWHFSSFLHHQKIPQYSDETFDIWSRKTLSKRNQEAITYSNKFDWNNGIGEIRMKKVGRRANKMQ